MIPNVSCRPELAGVVALALELAGVVALALTEPAVRASHRLARFKEFCTFRVATRECK